MSGPDVFTVLEDLAKRCDALAQSPALRQPAASAWLDRASKLRAASELILTQAETITSVCKSVNGQRARADALHLEVTRLQEIERLARLVDGLYDPRMKVVLMCTRYRDGVVDRSCHFDELREALAKGTAEAAQPKGTG